jgi:putative iron-regulated protein
MRNQIVKAIMVLSFFATTFTASANEEVLRQSIQGYSNHVYESYKESRDRAVLLKEALENFTKNPGVLTHGVAKEAWIYAREIYGQTEVFRFYDGPIDNEEGPEGLLNAWPLDEAYIDYVIGAPTAGIVNNTTDFPEITKELLSDLNELDGEKNVSTGYHAIEFLLWGQDLFVDGPGQRPYTDYVVGVGFNAERRAQYLNLAADLLVEHLDSLVAAWEPNKENYRAEFEGDNARVTLKKILSGVIFMAGDELSGERMYVAYETMGQEDEHSCFSDMTHMDIQWNFWGIDNVLKSAGILDLPELKGTELATAVKTRLASTRELLATIPVPFDQAILSEEGRAIILQSVEELEALADELVQVSEALSARVDF